MYNDNVNLHQAVPIDPFNITNLFFNYTLRGLVTVLAVENPAGGQQPHRPAMPSPAVSGGIGQSPTRRRLATS